MRVGPPLTEESFSLKPLRSVLQSPILGLWRCRLWPAPHGQR